MLFDTVKSLCESKNVTIAQLERSIKAGNGSIRRWNRAYPSADRLKRVADYFGVSMDYLMERQPASPQSQALARVIDGLPPEKQDLVKRYVEVVQKE